MFNYRWTLIWRWNLLLVLLFVLFWGIWDLSGDIPISIPPREWPFYYSLPILSRWWDIIVIPIYVPVLVYVLTSIFIIGDSPNALINWIKADIFFTSIIGFFAGLVWGLWTGFVVTIIACITVSIVILLIMFLDCVVDGTFKKWILAKDKKIK